MEQKSTGWTGTGIEVDEKKSKQNVIFENMNVKNGGRVIQGQNDEYISCNGGSSPLMSTNIN